MRSELVSIRALLNHSHAGTPRYRQARSLLTERPSKNAGKELIDVICDR